VVYVFCGLVGFKSVKVCVGGVGVLFLVNFWCFVFLKIRFFYSMGGVFCCYHF
jgi:hypothetical protein